MGGARSTGERPRASKRFLSVLSDERLSQRVRRGDEAAFEVLFDRHQRGVSALCASITRSPDDGEEVAQQTFLAAYRALRSGPRPERVRPWLYAIARNRSISELRRGHRAHEAPDAALDELPGPDMDEAVERRADLGQLLHDLGELPDDQRAALVLAEAADLPHAEIAAVLSCPPAKVKSLVYQARTGLMSRREARETPCEEFRDEIASRRGGALGWTPLRRHLARCPRCSNYLEHVRAQRATFALALPLLAPGLRDAVFGALAEESAPAAAAAVGAGIGAGAAGEVAKGGVIAALAGRTGARVAAVLGSGGGLSAPTAMLTKAGAAKAAVAVVTATGATVGGAAVVRERLEREDAGDRAPATAPQAERERERRPDPAGAGRERAAERRRAAREAKQRRPERGRGARRARRPRVPRFEPRLPRSGPGGPPPARSPKGESPGRRGGGGGGAGAPAVPPPRLPKPPRVPDVPKPPVPPDPPKLPDAPSLLP